MSQRSIDLGELRRGWRVILASFLAFGSGIITVPFFAAGAFVETLEREFHWSRAEIGLGVTILQIGTAMLSLLVGVLVDRFGARRVLLPAIVGAGAALGGLGFIQSLPTYFVAWALVPLLGAGTMPITFTRVITTWFDRSRGLALGLSLMGAGVAGALVPSYVAWLLHAYGWRAAFAGLALLPLLFGLPAAYLWFHNSPPATSSASTDESGADPGSQPGPTLGEALAQPRFWRLAAATFLAPIGLVGLITNFIPIVTGAGRSLSEAAGIFALYGVAVMGARALVGNLLDRFWAPGVGAAVLLGPAAAAALLATAPSGSGAAMSAALLIGLAGGAEFDLVAYFTSRYFGLRHYGKIYGIQYMTFEGGAALAPVLFGSWYDAHRNYSGILWITVGIFFVVPALLLSMGRYPSFQKRTQEAFA